MEIGGTRAKKCNPRQLRGTLTGRCIVSFHILIILNLHRWHVPCYYKLLAPKYSIRWRSHHLLNHSFLCGQLDHLQLFLL